MTDAQRTELDDAAFNSITGSHGKVLETVVPIRECDQDVLFIILEGEG